MTLILMICVTFSRIIGFYYLTITKLIKCFCYVGLRGGMFRYKRGFSKKQDEKKLFVFHQLFVGATIFFDSFEFTIIDVDDQTLRFMINHPEEVIYIYRCCQLPTDLNVLK